MISCLLITIKQIILFYLFTQSHFFKTLEQTFKHFIHRASKLATLGHCSHGRELLFQQVEDDFDRAVLGKINDYCDNGNIKRNG